MKKITLKRSTNRSSGMFSHAGAFAMEMEDSKAVEHEAKKIAEEIMRKARKTFLEKAA